MTESDDGVSLGRFLQLACVAVVVYACVHFTACQSIYIASASMEPTLKVGLSAFLDKLTLRFRAPERGEIICLLAPTAEREEVVKRVIAVGGDTVEMRDKKVLVNGRELSEPYARHTRSNERLTGDTFEAKTVPAGHVFVLGDNRDESNDSSVWKDAKTGEPTPFVRLSDVKGLIRGFY